MSGNESGLALLFGAEEFSFERYHQTRFPVVRHSSRAIVLMVSQGEVGSQNVLVTLVCLNLHTLGPRNI